MPEAPPLRSRAIAIYLDRHDRRIQPRSGTTAFFCSGCDDLRLESTGQSTQQRVDH